MLHIKPVRFLNNLLIILTIGIALSLIFIGHTKAEDIGSISANISATGIQTGIGPFDSDDDPGHDSSATNNIVRSYDVVTVPISLTIGNKSGDLDSYVLSIDGTIDNGYSNDQTNAVAYLPNSSTDTSSVNKSQNNTTFHIEYSDTRSLITYPLKIIVYGAPNGTKIKPHNITVTLKSINGIAQSSTSAKVQGLDNHDPITVSSIEDFELDELTCSTDSFNKGNFFHTPGHPDSLDLYYGVSYSPYISKGRIAPSNFDITFDMKSPQISPSSDFPNFPAYSFVPDKDSAQAYSSNGCISSIDYSVTNSPTVHFKNFHIATSSIDYYNPSNHFESLNSYNFVDLASKYDNNYWVGGPSNPNKIVNTITFNANANISFTSSITGQKVTKQLAFVNNIKNTPQSIPPSSIPDSFEGYAVPVSAVSSDFGTPSSFINYTSSTIGVDRELSYRAHFDIVSGTNDVPFKGGYTTIYNWNPNSFQLSSYDINAMQSEVNGQVTLQYGTVKNPEFVYTGKNMYNLTSNDFNWSNTPIGKVCAVKFDQTSSMIPIKWGSYDYILYLKSTSLLGTVGSDHNPNNIYQNATFYYDQARSQSVPGRAASEKYNNSDSYSNNNLVTKASDGNSFVTVNVVKNTLYGSTSSPLWKDGSSGTFQTLNVNASSNTNVSMLLIGLNTQLDSTNPDTKQKITRTVTLPEGVEYLSGSTKLANYNGIDYNQYPYPKPGSDQEPADPIETPTPGRQGHHNLTWTYYLSYNDLQKIKKQYPLAVKSMTEFPPIEYKVYLNSYNWIFNNGNCEIPLYDSYMVNIFDGPKNYVEGNTSVYEDYYSDEMSILNVNQIGGPEASSSMDSHIGYPGSYFTVATKPYVSSDSEKDLKGIVPLPENGDQFTIDGKKYTNKINGQIYITNAQVQVDSTKTSILPSAVDIYYSNDEAAKSENPNDTLTTKDSDLGVTWIKYNGDPSKLKDAKAIMYHINGDIQSTDRGISVNVTFQTINNRPGDVYYSQSTVNAASYGTNANTKSNTSAFSAYTIVDEFFSGKLWDDTNVNGLIDSGEPPFTDGIHLKLFKKAEDGSWHEDQRFDPVALGNTTDPVTIDGSGNYKIIAMEGGTYRVGVSKADLDNKGSYIPTLLQQGTDSSKNSQFSDRDVVKDNSNVNYYLTKDSYDLPDPKSGSSGGNYKFKDINGGFYSSVGNLDLSVAPSLDFGKQVIPLHGSKTFDNTKTTSNRITINDSRSSYVDFHYDLKVKLSPFKLNGTEEIPKSYVSFNKQSGINNLTLPTQVNVDTNQTEETLFSYTGSGAQTIDYTYDSIQLTTPQKSGTNPIDPGKYKATVTYSLDTAP